MHVDMHDGLPGGRSDVDPDIPTVGCTETFERETSSGGK